MAKRKPPKKGRPKLPTDRRREIRLEIRVSRAELDSLRRIAKGNISTWIRETVLALTR